jgi:hypothetical protein
MSTATLMSKNGTNSAVITRKGICMKYLTLDFLSAESAASVFHWANATLVCALIVGVLATYVIYATGTVKERYTNVELARANESAAKAQERAALIEKENAILRDKAALAERDLLQLKERLKARTISPQQRAAMAKTLASLPKGKIQIQCWSAGGHEAQAYSDEFKAIFTAAGFETKSMLLLTGGGTPGLHLVQGQEGQLNPSMHAASEAFKAAGIAVEILAEKGIAEGLATLFVGPKPT